MKKEKDEKEVGEGDDFIFLDEIMEEVRDPSKVAERVKNLKHKIRLEKRVRKNIPGFRFDTLLKKY